MHPLESWKRFVEPKPLEEGDAALEPGVERVVVERKGAFGRLEGLVAATEEVERAGFDDGELGGKAEVGRELSTPSCVEDRGLESVVPSAPT
jgi:hypothetical protein